MKEIESLLRTVFHRGIYEGYEESGKEKDRFNGNKKARMEWYSLYLKACLAELIKR